MRAISRVFGISRNTLGHGLKKCQWLPSLSETFASAQPDDVLELDEL